MHQNKSYFINAPILKYIAAVVPVSVVNYSLFVWAWLEILAL